MQRPDLLCAFRRALCTVAVCLVTVCSSLPALVARAEDAGADTAVADKAGIEFFEKKIRPVLVEHCYECHSAKSAPLQGGLRLDTREATRKGGDSGAAVVPESADDSVLLAALRYDGFEMPPKGKLPESVIADFEKWILMGAPDPREGDAPVADAGIDFEKAAEFWAFRSPRKAELPAVQNAAWPKNAIDHFVLARLEQEGLHPVRMSSRRELIRRASFNLLGLPPSPEDVARFLADESPEAYARLIDRLLQSPHYGERWGRYWLDVARYAEDQAHTFAVKPNTEAWRYRQWVIDSLNSDLPYDDFVRYQIAGDTLDASAGYDRYVALGYFGLGAVYYKNSDKAKAIADELDDRIDTLTRGFLGLTVSCARCHDHKFDPIPTADYYSLAGIFSSSPLYNVPLVEQEVVDAYNQGQQNLKQAEKALTDRTRELRESLAESQSDQIARYVLAVWKQQVSAAHGKPLSHKQLAEGHGLSEPAVKLWADFLSQKNRGKHAALAAWYGLPKPTAETPLDEPAENVRQVARNLQTHIQNVLLERDGKPAEGPTPEPQPDGKPLFASGAVNRQRPLVEIDIELNGARKLYLVITDAGDGKSCDHADWIEPRLVTKNGEQKLTDLKWTRAETGYGSVNLNRSVGGGPLKVGDQTFEYGIGTHAPGLIMYDLPEGIERFRAKAGLDVSGTGQNGGATVTFMVFTSQPPAAVLADSGGSGSTKPGKPKLSRQQQELLKAVFADGGLFRLNDKEFPQALPAEQAEELKSLTTRRDAARKAAPPMYPVAHAIHDNRPADLKVYIRGNPARQGEPAPRQFLRILAGEERSPYDTGSGRRELADDIASASNPLTARVIVNRVWQHHFGRGLVGTPSNFGELGERPTHPALLDWLAVDFMEHGWSLKHLHRTIMLSATWQLSSDTDPRNAETDGDNRFLWRMNRRRLDVEAWRDSLLDVAGNLDRKVGGRNAPLTGKRRTVYARISRHELDELLRLFDFPDANVTSAKRTVTTVPQQQLFVLNSSFVIEQARALAARLQQEATTDEARIDRAFALLFARPPQDVERQIGLQFLRAAAEQSEEQKIDAWQQYAQALLSLNEFMYID